MPHSAISQTLRPARSFGLPVNESRTGAFRAVKASGVVSANSTARRGNPVRQPRDENVAGDFYVDHTCIGTLRQYGCLCLDAHEQTFHFQTADCDTCRWMDPETYGRVGNMSAVVRQPETPDELEKAMQALITCPT